LITSPIPLWAVGGSFHWLRDLVKKIIERKEGMLYTTR